MRSQITRVIIERLIVQKPHPWGLLVTLIELGKNFLFAPRLLCALDTKSWSEREVGEPCMQPLIRMPPPSSPIPSPFSPKSNVQHLAALVCEIDEGDRAAVCRHSISLLVRAGARFLSVQGLGRAGAYAQAPLVVPRLTSYLGMQVPICREHLLAQDAASADEFLSPILNHSGNGMCDDCTSPPSLTSTDKGHSYGEGWPGLQPSFYLHFYKSLFELS